MRPDLHNAMRGALALGPGHCPPDLFAGTVQAIVSGLRAHDATIVRARHAALEDTFPRTRRLLGEKRFAALADVHLERGDTLRRPLNDIGRGFPDLLTGGARFLARIEWAWLEAHGAPDARALTIADLAGMEPEAIVSMRVGLHPATRVVGAAVEPAGPVEFDGTTVTSAALVTRPGSEVLVRQAAGAVAGLVRLIREPQALGVLLARDPDSAAVLVEAGALALEAEPGR